MEPITNVAELQHYQIILNIRDLAAQNNVCADFIEWNPGHQEDKHAGVYFVVTPDLDTLLSLKRNMKEFPRILEEDSKRSKKSMNCYYNIVKISDMTDQNLFSKHNDMCRAIQNMSIVKNSFYEFGYHLPKEVRLQTIDNFTIFNQKRNDPKMPLRLKSRYDDVMKAAVSESYSLYTAQEKRPDVKTIPFHKHQVHADFFIKNHIQTTYETVDKPFYEYIKERMHENPEFVYYKELCPSIYLKDDTKFDGPDELNFWKNLTEVTSYNIGFPTAQENIFYGWMIDYNVRNYTQRISLPALQKDSNEIITLVVDQLDMWNFNSLCSSNNIQYAVNTGQIHDITSDDVRKLTIAIRITDKNAVDLITSRLAQEKRGYSPTTSLQMKNARLNGPKTYKNPYLNDPAISR